MGKSLIIKGADFSANGIVPEFTQLDYIVGVNVNGVGIKVPDSYQPMVDGMAVQMILKINQIQEGTVQQMQTYTPVNGRNLNTRVRVWSTMNFTELAYGSNTPVRLGYSIIGDGKDHHIYLSPTKVSFDTDETITETFHLSYCSHGIGLDCSSDGNNSYQGISNDYLETLVKEVKVWNENGVLTVHAIPVKRTSDNVVCFYNIISDEYYERNNDSTPSYILDSVRYDAE